MAEIEFFQRPAGVHPSVGYSHAAAGTGRLVAISGQVALDENGAVVGVGDPGRQAERVFANLVAALAAAGGEAADIVKLTYYLTSMADLPAVIVARDRYVDASRPPASTVVEVRALYRPEIQVEVEAIALVNR